MTKRRKFTEWLQIRVPKKLTDEVEREAKRRFMTVSEYVRQVLIKELELEDEDGNEIPHTRGDMRHCTITLYLDEKKATKLSDLAASTGRTKSELISFLIDWIRPGVKRGDIIVDRNGNEIPKDS